MLISHDGAGAYDAAAGRLGEVVGLLNPLCAAQGLLIAVSGGPDSTALMHMTAAWRRAPDRPPVSVACVDHGLRPGSHAEAATVTDAAATLGLPGAVLTWTGKKPKRGLPAAAREARYSLLTQHARSIGASHIVTAHNRDDQAETILMRLAAGSGLPGLAGMRDTVALHGLVLARPFLEVSKADLVALCDAQGWPYAEDPTNHDPAYARSRWRALAAHLEPEGLSNERLARLSRRVQRAEQVLARIAADVSRSVARPESPDGQRLDFTRLAAEPDEIVIRVLLGAVATVSAQTDQPRLERTERLAEALLSACHAGRLLRRTLHGCVLALGHNGVLTITREGERRRGSKGALQHKVAFSATHEPPRSASLGKPRPPSYIGVVDAPARSAELVEPHSASASVLRGPMLCTGPQ